jgi:hypothetical protein
LQALWSFAIIFTSSNTGEAAMETKILKQYWSPREFCEPRIKVTLTIKVSPKGAGYDKVMAELGLAKKMISDFEKEVFDLTGLQIKQDYSDPWLSISDKCIDITVHYKDKNLRSKRKRDYVNSKFRQAGFEVW